MLTLHLWAAALSWGDFHIKNFLLRKTVSLNKNSSLLVHHINMPERGLAKASVTFLTAYPSSLKATTEKYCSLLIPNFQGSSLKKKNQTRPPLRVHRSQLPTEEEFIKAGVTSCCISVQHLTQQTPDLAQGAAQEAAALRSGESLSQPVISCLKLP